MKETINVHVCIQCDQVLSSVFRHRSSQNFEWFRVLSPVNKGPVC